MKQEEKPNMTMEIRRKKRKGKIEKEKVRTKPNMHENIVKKSKKETRL